MTTKIKKIAIVYKNSVYGQMESRSSGLMKKMHLSRRVLARLREAHQNHFQSLTKIEAALQENKISYDKIKRGVLKDFRRYDLVVTIGGDGTFLETARGVTTQLILGVNSDMRWSTGRFCATNAETFPRFLDEALEGKRRVSLIQRLQLYIDNKLVPFKVLNDFLICHRNPAAMSHYYLRVRGREEEQRSSGIWVSTAAGSTAATFSAGGRILPLTSPKFQYLPRELYCDGRCRYMLRGGTLNAGEKFQVVSCMTEGMIFIDGTHLRIPFYFGSRLSVKRCPEPLRVLMK